MPATTRFLRVDFSLFHLEVWRRTHGRPRIFFIRYTRTEAVVVHTALA